MVGSRQRRDVDKSFVCFGPLVQVKLGKCVVEEHVQVGALVQVACRCIEGPKIRSKWELTVQVTRIKNSLNVKGKKISGESSAGGHHDEEEGKENRT